MAATPAKDSSNPALPPVYNHAAEPHTTLLPHLHPGLPYSLPLYRRIQFHHHHPSSRSPDAHILATVPAADPTPPQTPGTGTVTQDTTTSASPSPSPSPPPTPCLAAAYLDRARRPETECWLHLSWDHPLHHQETENCTCGAHLAALLARIATLPYPPLSPETLADIFAAVTAPDAADVAARHHAHTSMPAAAFLRGLEAPGLLKVGTMHARGVGWVARKGWGEGGDVGVGFAYRKYVFGGGGGGGAGVPPPPPPSEEEMRERGLRWGRVREEDIGLVRGRSAIPRTHHTIRMLPSVAVFPAGDEGEEQQQQQQPVAWAFLSLDGSLGNLHVEPEYRGRGLAKAMGRKLFREAVGAFGDELGGLVHADVALENSESNGVCKSLGGVDEGWHVHWVRIDLDRVQADLGASQ